MTLESNAAESAEKSITCAVAKKGYACILAGGLKTIGDGPIAKVKYASRGCACGGAHAGVVTVRVGEILGVSTGMGKMTSDNAEGRITVR